MFEAINSIGVAGLPLVLLAIAIVFLTIRYSLMLFRGHDGARVDINNVLYLGTFGLLLGVFSHFLGLYQGTAIMAQLRPDQIAAGYGQSLLALLYGFAVFFIAAIAWFVLRLRTRSSKFETV